MFAAVARILIRHIVNKTSVRVVSALNSSSSSPTATTELLAAVPHSFTHNLTIYNIYLYLSLSFLCIFLVSCFAVIQLVSPVGVSTCNSTPGLDALHLIRKSILFHQCLENSSFPMTGPGNALIADGTFQSRLSSPTNTVIREGRWSW
jgi:hypothetical protein